MLLGDIRQHLQTITECPDWSIGCIHSDQPKSIAVLGKQGVLQAVHSNEQSYASKTIELVIRWDEEAEAEQTAQQLLILLAQPGYNRHMEYRAVCASHMLPSMQLLA